MLYVLKVVRHLIKSISHDKRDDYDIRNLFESKGTYNVDRYFANRLYKSIHLSEISLCNTIEDTDDRNGCVIVFSSVLNYDKSDIVSKLNVFAEKYNIIGFMLDHAMHDKYIKLNTKFDKKSLTAEVIGLSVEQSIELAKELCSVLKQQSVLVRSINTRSIWCITKLK